MLLTSAGVEPATSWSPVGQRIQLSHRDRHLTGTCYFVKNKCFLVPLAFTTLLANSADDKFVTVFLFFKKTGFDILCKLSPMETVCMKCQLLFSGKKRKIISICRLQKILPRNLSISLIHFLNFGTASDISNYNNLLATCANE